MSVMKYSEEAITLTEKQQAALQVMKKLMRAILGPIKINEEVYRSNEYNKRIEDKCCYSSD